eukprot:scaffold235435_cov23-Tisochrysis_lutea.AAC.1
MFQTPGPGTYHWLVIYTAIACNITRISSSFLLLLLIVAAVLFLPGACARQPPCDLLAESWQKEAEQMEGLDLCCNEVEKNLQLVQCEAFGIRSRRWQRKEAQQKLNIASLGLYATLLNPVCFPSCGARRELQTDCVRDGPPECGGHQQEDAGRAQEAQLRNSHKLLGNGEALRQDDCREGPLKKVVCLMMLTTLLEAIQKQDLLLRSALLLRLGA